MTNHIPIGGAKSSQRKGPDQVDETNFFRGIAAEGIGGPHMGTNMIWPLSMILRALTTEDEHEILQCLRWLIKCSAQTGFMHESFHKDNPNRYTRAWFAWANTLFGELILKLYADSPSLLARV